MLDDLKIWLVFWAGVYWLIVREKWAEIATSDEFLVEFEIYVLTIQLVTELLMRTVKKHSLSKMSSLFLYVQTSGLHNGIFNWKWFLPISSRLRDCPGLFCLVLFLFFKEVTSRFYITKSSWKRVASKETFCRSPKISRKIWWNLFPRWRLLTNSQNDILSCKAQAFLWQTQSDANTTFSCESVLLEWFLENIN